jgi:hypothetical protein
MIRDVLINLLASGIGFCIAWMVLRLKVLHRTRFSQEYIKFTYYRVVRLRFKDRGDLPYYERVHHTLKGRTTEVFDEAWCINATMVKFPEVLEPIQLTCSGMVDAVQIVPVLNRSTDNHPHSRDDSKQFICHHDLPSNRFAAVATLINGLQTPSEWWYGATAQYNGQSLSLIVDFSSLPLERSPIRGIRSVLERDNAVVMKENVQKDWFEERIKDDMIFVRFTNARKGDLIRILFDIDFDLLPRQRARETPHRTHASDSAGNSGSAA